MEKKVTVIDMGKAANDIAQQAAKADTNVKPLIGSIHVVTKK